MKKIILIFFVFLMTVQSVCAEEPFIKKQADVIYKKCQNSIIQGETSKEKNIETNNITNEQKIRQCLKDDIINIAKEFIEEDEINNLRKIMNDIENSSMEMYRILVFCTQNEDESWCKDNYRQRNSLGKLVLEKNITSQIYHILLNVLESKSGGYIF